jgi:hypothetical protein
MDKTERFRGRLMSGDQVLLEPVLGQLKSHARVGGGVGEWTGYFEFPPSLKETFVAGNRYRLVLIDGRSGHIHVHIPDHDPLDRTIAEFHGTGSIRR